MSVIRTARKDKYSPFGGKLIAKKGEKYIDCGFGQIASYDSPFEMNPVKCSDCCKVTRPILTKNGYVICPECKYAYKL